MALDPRAQESYDGIMASKVNVDIVNASHLNLTRLRGMNLNNSELEFYQRFRNNLPIILEHRASAEQTSGWQAIKGGTKQWGGVKNPDAQLLSLFELSKLMAVRRGEAQVNGKAINTLKVTDVTFPEIKQMLGNIKINTSDRDFANFGNVDFVFFKLGIAGNHINLDTGHAGVAAGKPKFFNPKKLYDEGWISLDDWVSYSAGGLFKNNLNIVWHGFPENGLTVSYSKPHTKTYCYSYYTEYAKLKFNQHNMKKAASFPLIKQLSEEVFFGDDILPGLALSVVEHLKFADPMGGFIESALAKDFAPKVSALIANIWRLVEAKLPGSMRYYDFKISKDEAKGRVPVGATEVSKFF
jgi:hypothetical protein